MKKIKKLLMPLCAAVVLSLGVVGNVGLLAAAPADDACKGIELAGGTCNTTSGTSGFQGIIRTIISVLSIVVGAISVIMIIVGGFRYVVSGGDSNSTKGAKDTIMYAVIGLVIVLFAQVIISFVWTQSSNTTSTPSTPATTQ